MKIDKRRGDAEAERVRKDENGSICVYLRVRILETKWGSKQRTPWNDEKSGKALLANRLLLMPNH